MYLTVDTFLNTLLKFPGPLHISDLSEFMVPGLLQDLEDLKSKCSDTSRENLSELQLGGLGISPDTCWAGLWDSIFLQSLTIVF
jgi:hypothetical protein